MEFIKLSLLLLFISAIAGCANVNYYLGSAAKLDPKKTFKTDEPYTYYDKEVSGRFTFENFELTVTPYNTIATEKNFELFFVSVDKQGPFYGDVGKNPFMIEIRLRGEKDKVEFHPLKSKLNSSIKVKEVKFRDPIPECNYVHTEWKIIDSNVPHTVPDKNRNKSEKCYKQGWLEYLLVFDVETPNPKNDFSLTVLLKDIETGAWVSKTIYFSAAKFISTQRH
jgi:hypothetical protein